MIRVYIYIVLDKEELSENESDMMIHEHCMTVRNNAIELLFGAKPNIDKARVLSKQEEQEEGMNQLREFARYRPTNEVECIVMII